MGQSKRRARQFLQKEIKTYMALALFLSKKSMADRVRLGRKEVLIGPAFYKDRIKEAKELVDELTNTR